MNYDLLLLSKQYVISSIFIKESLKYNLTLNDFLLLLYFLNSDDKVFDLDKINSLIGVDKNNILESFNNLSTKKLINIEVAKDNLGHINEHVSLNGFLTNLDIDIKASQKELEKENIFDVFEREFNRKLTPMEYEIINAWLDNNILEELILGALKEAIYNGVKSFRYIDKIIYEWTKKGFKTMEDVKNHINNSYKKEAKKEPELFDYDWLDGND